MGKDRGWFAYPKMHSRIRLRILILGIIVAFVPQATLLAWPQAVRQAPGGQTAAQQKQGTAPGPTPGQSTTQPPTPNPAASGAPTTVSPDEVVLTVGDTKITAKEFEALIRFLPPEVAGAVPNLGERGFAEQYAKMLILAKEGEKRQVDQSEAFRRMTAFQHMLLLTQLTFNQLMTAAGALSPDEVNSYYSSHQSEFQQLKLRGIYIPFATESETANVGKPPAAPTGQADPKQPSSPTDKPKLTEAEAKAKAEALRKRIQAGEKIEDLAKRESDHPTAAKGGDFGFVRRNQFPPQIDSEIFSLELNQVSEPLRDRFGFFIFQLEEKRAQPLEEVKSPIENILRQQKIAEVLSKVQAENPITFNPKYFGEPAPAPPGSPLAPSGSAGTPR